MPDNLLETPSPDSPVAASALSEFDRFFEATLSPMIAAGFDGYMKRVNRACEELAGFTADELKAQPFSHFIHPDDWETAHIAILEMASAGGSRAVDIRILYKDGSYRWTEWTGTPFPDQKVFYLIGKDVTDKHLARKALEKQARAAEDLERFFNNAPDAMYVGGYDGYIKRSNSALQALTGFTAEQLVAEPIVAFAHPDERDRVAAEVQNIITGGVTRGIELRVRCSNGSYKRLVWNASNFADLQVFYAIGTDVTARRAAEAALAERTKQQEAVAELGSLALAAFDLSQLMRGAVELTARTLQVEFAEIRELSPDCRQTTLKAGVGWREGPLAQAPIGADPDTVSGYIISTDQPVVIEDLASDVRFHESEMLREHGVVSGAGCVIHGPQRTFGVLAAYANRSRTFTSDDVRFLQAAASVLSAAINRLHAIDDFNRFFDSSPDLMIIAGFDGGIRRMNSPAGAENYLTPEDVRDQPLLSFVHPDDKETVARELEKLFTTGATKPFEARSRMKDGSYDWFSWSATAFPDRQILYAVGQNTTARRRAEEELRRLFDNSPDVLAICGFDGSFKRYNPACLAVSGFTADEVAQMSSFLDTVNPDDRAAAAGQLQKLREGGRLSSYEIRGRRKDGSPIWISWNVAAFPDWQEYFITGHVVTERHIAEDSLRQRARQQQAVAELGSRVLATADLTAIMTDAAAVLARTLDMEYSEILELQPGEHELLVKAGFGWKEEEIGQARVAATADTVSGYLLATKAPVVVEDLEHETRFQGARQLQEQGTTSGMACLIPGVERPYGVLGAHSVRARSFSDDDVHFLEAVANIVAAAIERKRSELERERFFDRSLAPMLIIGFDGTVKYANPAATAVSGHSRDELTSSPYLSFVHPDDAQRAAATLPELMAGKSFHDFEVRIRCKDGSHRWFAFDSSPDPERQAFYAIVHDVTDRHLAEDALAARARQQQAVAELGASALSGGDLQTLFNETVAAISRTLQVEFATLLELQPDDREFVLRAGCGWRPELIGKARLPANPQFFGGYVLSSDAPVFVENVWTESRFHPYPLVAAHSITSELACVIPGRPQPRGVLCVHSTRSRKFQEDDAHFLQAAAYILAAAIDRRRAEEELKRYVEPSLNPMFVGSFDGTLKRGNHAIELLTGYSLEEMRGRPIAAFVHPDDRQTVATEIVKVATGEPAHAFSVRVVAKDGSTKWTVWNATSFPEWQEFYATGQDVTEQHRAEEELRASEEMLEATDDSALDGIVLLDAEGKVAHWNAAAEKIFGFSSEEICGRNLHHTVVPPEMRESYERGWQLFQQTGAGPVIGKVLELEALRKDGSRFPVEVSVAAVSLHGRWNAVGVIRDITSRKQQEAELIAAKKSAEAANRAKSDFLANMSHEIRTPMNGVIGLTSLVLDTELTPEQRQYLDGVMLSAEALLRIINDILDFSKIEAGRLELDHIDFDLREAVGDTVQTLALRAHEKGLELTYAVRPEAPDALVGDPARLWQVIVNLVGNAIKFTDEGEVSLSVAVETLQEHAVCLHFTVCDTGIGIPADKQHTLFKPFSQIDSSMARKYGGTGLGLAISAQIVDMMKGRIWFESELGKGSKFHFTAWFDRRTTPLAKRAPLPPSALDNLHVLVVDDNSTNRTILRDMLTHWGMRPEEADGGAVGLDSLQAAFKAGDSFGLILLDVMMPGMDGFEVLERIRQMPEIDRPVIMMLSSRDQPGDSARARKLGAAAYIIKPIRPSDLLDAIVRALDISFEAGAVKPPAPTAAGPRGPSLRILVAEDNPINQMLAVRMLEKAGHSVAKAGNGQEVLEAIGQASFDLVLMDVQMPVMDGLEATALIRQQEKQTGGHLPIVAMTAHAMKGDRERCLAAGMDAYVAKPVQKAELFAAIAAAVAPPQNSAPASGLSPVPSSG